MKLIIVWTTTLGSRSSPTIALVPDAIKQLREEILYLKATGTKKPRPDAPAGASPVGGRDGTAAEKNKVKSIGNALGKAWNGRFTDEWLAAPTLIIASALDVRTALDSHATFGVAMDMLEASDLVTAEERTVQAPAPAAAGVAANPFAVALVQQGGAGAAAVAVSAFRRGVAKWRLWLSKLDPTKVKDMDPLDELRKFSQDPVNGDVIIPRAARTILAVQPESTDCERFFSLAGMVINRHRASLSPETAEAQILLSAWLRRDASIAGVVPEMKDSQAETVAFLDFIGAAVDEQEEEDAGAEDADERAAAE